MFMARAPGANRIAPFEDSLLPELVARKPGSFAECFQLCPHNRGMHAAIERPLRKTAIGAGNDVLASNNSCKPHDAPSDQFRMFHHIGGVADNPWDEYLAAAEPGIFPDLPFVLVARIGALDHVGANLHFQDEVDDVLERHVAGMRAGPAAPAHMITDAV